MSNENKRLVLAILLSFLVLTWVVVQRPTFSAGHSSQEKSASADTP